MVPHDPSARPPVAADPDRPRAFLVSAVGEAAADPGSAPAAWLEALTPRLERLGRIRRIDRAESRLAFLAEQADRDGERPLQVVFGRPDECYLTPAVPTALFCTWPYPDIPDRPFGVDLRRDWTRICRRLDLVVVPDDATAAAFARAGVECPVAVVPLPADPEALAVPDWEPGHRVTLECRHLVAGGHAPAVENGPAILPPDPIPAISPWKRTLWTIGQRGFHRVSPHISHKTRLRIDALRANVLYLFGRAPGTLAPLPGGRPTLRRVAAGVARRGYRSLIGRWLSDEARLRIRGAKHRLDRALGRPIPAPVRPEVPSMPLELGGLVYLAALDPSDPLHNAADLISAFVFAFRDRPDAMLVVRLTGPAAQRADAARAVVDAVAALKLLPRCRVAAIAEDLAPEARARLLRVSAFAVSAARVDGDALDLRAALAAGRPALAPDHSAPGELVDAEVGFPVPAHPEPTSWPGDPEGRPDTSWYRPVWSALRSRFVESAAVVDMDLRRYRRLAEAARRRMVERATGPAVDEALADVLARVEPAEIGALAWSR